jgi:hypothetical protein
MGAAAQIISGDVLGDIYQLAFGDVRLVAKRSSQRAEFRIVNDPSKVGVIRIGGPGSGALWINEECIAEYERQGTEYLVTPISEGRKKIDEAVQVNPVEFLLTRLTEGR